MKELKQKRELLIENKIFSKSDLKSLIKIFINQSIEILEKSKQIKRQNLIQEGWQEKNSTDQHSDTSHSGIEFNSSENTPSLLRKFPKQIKLLIQNKLLKLNCISLKMC